MRSWLTKCQSGYRRFSQILITVGVEQNVTDRRNYACAPAPDPSAIWNVFTNAKDVLHLHEDRRFGYRRRRQTKPGIQRGGHLPNGPLMSFRRNSWTLNWPRLWELP